MSLPRVVLSVVDRSGSGSWLLELVRAGGWGLAAGPDLEGAVAAAEGRRPAALLLVDERADGRVLADLDAAAAHPALRGLPVVLASPLPLPVEVLRAALAAGVADCLGPPWSAAAFARRLRGLGVPDPRGDAEPPGDEVADGAILRALPDAALIVAPDDGRVLALNPTAANLLERRPADCLGQPLGLPLRAGRQRLDSSPDAPVLELRLRPVVHAGRPALLVRAADRTAEARLEAGLAEAARREQLLAALAASSLRGASRQGLLREAVAVAVDALGAPQVAVLSLVPGDARARLIAGHGLPPVVLGRATLSRPLPWGLDRAWEQEGSVPFDPAHADAGPTDPSPAWRPDGAGLAVSLHGRPIGPSLLVAVAPPGRPFGPDDRRFLERLGRGVSARIEQLLAVQALPAAGVPATATPEVGCWELHFASGELCCDAGVAAICGVGPEVLRDRDQARRALTHPGDWERMAAARAQVLATGAPLDLEHRVLRPDGEVRHVRLLADLVHDEQGAPALLCGTIIDLTSERRALQEAQELSERLGAAQEVGRVGSWETDLKSMRVSWSDETYRIFGLDRAQFQTSHDSFLGRVHPDDRAAVDRAFQESLQADADGSWCIEHRIQRPDGEVRVVEERWRVSRGDPYRRDRAVGTCRDVTEARRAETALRASEELFRRTFSDAGTGIAVVDLEGRFREVNEAFCRILGTSAESLRGQSVVERTHPDDRAATAAALAQLRSGGPRLQLDKRYLREGGDSVWCRVSSSLIRDAEGRPSHFVGVAIDVHAQRLAEQRLLRIQRVHALQGALGMAALQVQDSEALHAQVCAIAVRTGGLCGAWVGAIDPGAGTLRAVARAGEVDADRAAAGARLEGGPAGEDPIGRAVRAGRAVVCGRIAADPLFADWREEAALQGVASAAVFPLLQEGGVAGVLVLLAEIEGYFDDEEVGLFEQLASDLALRAGYLDESARRARAEADRARSERRFSAVFDQAVMGLCVVGACGRYQRVNQRFCELVGRSADALLGAGSWLEVAHPEDRAAVDQAVASLGAGAPSAVVELRIPRADREGAWARLTLSPLRDPEEAQELLLCVVEDVTERRAQDAQLRLLESCINHLNDIVLITDAEPIDAPGPIIRYVNDAFVRRTGWAREEVIGLSPRLLQGPRTQREELDRIRAALSAWRPVRAELINYTRAGEEFWLELDIVPIADETGWFTHWVSVERDVTERKRVEEQMRQTQSLVRMAGRTARLGGWTLDVADSRVVWSDEVCAIHDLPAGYQPSLGEAVAFYPPEYRDRIARLVEACIHEGLPFDDELQIVTAQGRRIWVRSIGEAVRDEEGRIHRIQGAFQDISRERDAQAAARDASRRLVSTLESITDAFVTFDRDWRFTYVNGAAERLLERSRAELLGQVLWEALPAATELDFHRELRLAVATGEPVSFEELYSPLGRWLDVRAFPGPDGLAVYLRDVTEARAHREALQVSQQRLALLAKATHDAIRDWDVGSDTLWWSEGFTTLFGHEGGQAARSGPGWLDHVHAEDRARVEASLRAAVAGAADTWSEEYRFLRADGGVSHVLDRGYLIRRFDGAAIRMVSGMTDLTEQKRADAKMIEQATLLDAAREAIVVRDLEDRIIYWNQGAERCHGWTAEEALGRQAAELLGLERGLYLRALERLLREDEWQGELNLHTRAGQEQTVDAHWTLVRDAAGQPKSVLGIHSDITARRKLELQFLRTQRMESIGTLAGGIAHDLNNILSPILMSVDLLAAETTDPEQLETIDTIGRCAERGVNLVRRILGFARGEEGARVLLDLAHVAAEVRRLVHDTFPKNIVFELRRGRDLWSVLGDPTQLLQVLTNLCVNARDAMPNGGRLVVTIENAQVDEVYAGMSPQSNAGAHLLLEVADSGTGIPRELHQRIFDPFFTTKGVEAGTGLGLATVQTIVKSHGGFINVYSEPGRGTKFKVYLPATDATAVEPPATLERVSLPRGQGELVLVVDDEEPIRSVTKRTLERYGYRVLLANNGAEAVALYARRTEEIALVLTDMAMPIMDGPSMIIALQAIDPKVRIIGSSGHAQNDAVARALGAGVAHFVPKPYTAERLLHVLREVLGSAR